MWGQNVGLHEIEKGTTTKEFWTEKPVEVIKTSKTHFLISRSMASCSFIWLYKTLDYLAYLQTLGMVSCLYVGPLLVSQKTNIRKAILLICMMYLHAIYDFKMSQRFEKWKIIPENKSDHENCPPECMTVKGNKKKTRRTDWHMQG